MLIALSIAGSDSSGGAGVQADLKTFQSLGIFGVSALTAVTVQNTQKVYSVHELLPTVVRDQILCLFDDMSIDVVKIGMVSNSEIIRTISSVLKLVDNCPIILDPVMVSKSGCALLDDEAQTTLVKELFPIVSVITPNIYEAEILTKCRIESVDDMKIASRKLFDMGAKKIIVKGGHLEQQAAIDVVFDGDKFFFMEEQRLDTLNTHGTGCTFSSAVAAYMAKGNDFFRAASYAKQYITGAIENSLDIGKGPGPTNHFFDLYERAGMSV